MVSIFRKDCILRALAAASHGSITLLPESSFGTLRKFRVVICSKAEHEWLTPFRPNRGIIPRKTKKTFHKSIMGISEIVCGFSNGDSHRISKGRTLTKGFRLAKHFWNGTFTITSNKTFPYRGKMSNSWAFWRKDVQQLGMRTWLL